MASHPNRNRSPTIAPDFIDDEMLDLVAEHAPEHLADLSPLKAPLGPAAAAAEAALERGDSPHLQRQRHRIEAVKASVAQFNARVRAKNLRPHGGAVKARHDARPTTESSGRGEAGRRRRKRRGISSRPADDRSGVASGPLVIDRLSSPDHGRDSGSRSAPPRSGRSSSRPPIRRRPRLPANLGSVATAAELTASTAQDRLVRATPHPRRPVAPRPASPPVHPSSSGAFLCWWGKCGVG